MFRPPKKKNHSAVLHCVASLPASLPANQQRVNQSTREGSQNGIRVVKREEVLASLSFWKKKQIVHLVKKNIDKMASNQIIVFEG